MAICLSDICNAIQVAFPEGTEDFLLSGPGDLETAIAGQISFLSNEKYRPHLAKTAASVVICSKRIADETASVLLKVDNPYKSFAKVLALFDTRPKPTSGIHITAVVENTAVIGMNVSIGALVFVGEKSCIGQDTILHPQVFIGANVTIGKNCLIYPGVKILDGSKIGDNCILHAGVVIGSDGFGFAPNMQGIFEKVPQIGHVVVEDDVEIGANTTIDRATFGATIIHKGVKIDNLVQVAHNVEIGENTVIAAQAGISGSTKLDRNVVVGGQAGFVGHIYIAPFAQINAQSGVSKSIEKPGMKVSGSPAIGFTEQYKAYAVYRKLPELLQKIKELEDFLSLQSQPQNK
ncbi:MAG: UDP-3-O-(3-hydroxymyristoyl)glucosamine N-acyltransferase [Chitinophagales bacterium]|nr:UDP-3-O-(3-hydroxymyristoyl)glucosamine N-acyltransferase [Chitinophagales bacterium]